MTKRNWTSLLLSNVLLTLPVMFSAGVLGYLFADLANWFLHTGFNDSQFPEFVRNDENIRALCVFASIPAGFLVAQICFILKVLRQEEFAPVRFLRFRLVTGLILTCAAAGLLYLNVVEVPVQVQQNFSRVRYGWPFCYSTISTWAGSEPDVTSFHGNIAINALFCLDLLLILLVVLEFFLARRDALSRTAGDSTELVEVILPASPSRELYPSPRDVFMRGGNYVASNSESRTGPHRSAGHAPGLWRDGSAGLAHLGWPAGYRRTGQDDSQRGA